MCGIIGVSNNENASKIAFLGLYALQHRGEEAAGIASYDGKEIHLAKNPGLVADAITETSLQSLKGSIAIGHCRYSTTGSSNYKNIQPFLVIHRNSPVAVAHNGNLTNTQELYDKLEETGSIFQTSMDTELIVHLLARNNGQKDLKSWFTNVLTQLEGAFSLVFLVGDTLVGARDPHGFRPLWLGKLENGYVLASENSALDIIQAEHIREIQPGEIVIINKDKIESHFLPEKPKNKAFCIFENVYFARPDSHIFDDNVYQVRKRLGAKLAEEHPVQGADFVMPIPDSGVSAAIGYAHKLNIPFEVGMIRNHYIGRTFIQPTQFVRDFRVRVKLNPIKDMIKGKKVVVVEDSIVRGTTSRNRIEGLRRAGAKEIHLRISCPPIKWPCFYGIDFPSKGELIASNKTIKEIADFIQVDSLEYLSLEGMLSVMKSSGDFCHACFDGKYPVRIPTTQSKYLLEEKSVKSHG